MRLPFRSIRWRLQLWHGAILVAVLVVFGSSAYHLVRENRLYGIDQQLQHRIDQLFEAAEPTPASLRPPPSGVGDGRNVPIPFSGTTGTDGTPLVPEGYLDLREMLSKAALPEFDDAYYIYWSEDGSVIRRSRLCPALVPVPSISPSGLRTRVRADFRERIIVTRAGLRFLVGRSVAADLADLRRQAWLMALAGCGVAILGLAGGWWLASRAIKPIRQIGAAAQSIASGNLAERIDVLDTDSELGQLATVLNTTFDRLQAAFDQLQQACKRQAEFTADASHELRTPVSVILAEASSALARPRTPEEYREAMESCRRAARRLHRLTEALLTLARVDSAEHAAQRCECDLEPIVQDTLALLRPLAEQRQVVLRADLTASRLVGVGSELEMAIVNLIGNAIHFNHPGGGVWVRLATEGGTLVLEVRDDGQGIAAEDLPRVFERFYRADKARSRPDGHVGLGLAIAKAFVESHRGTIHVSSTLGKGSTFTVRLPRS